MEEPSWRAKGDGTVRRAEGGSTGRRAEGGGTVRRAEGGSIGRRVEGGIGRRAEGGGTARRAEGSGTVRNVTLTISMYYWIDPENYPCTIDYPLGSICVLLCKYSCHIGTLSIQRL